MHLQKLDKLLEVHIIYTETRDNKPAVRFIIYLLTVDKTSRVWYNTLHKIRSFLC